jgi:GT2 family glycosyltransferase
VSPNPRVSIVIVNFCTRRLLRDCLACVRDEGSSGLEVIVVDNHSVDGSGEMVRTEFPGVQLIENTENLGFAKANNQAIRRAKGGYVLLLNSDTVVRPGALRAMADFLDARPEAGGVTCRLLNPDGSLQACVSRRPGPVMLLFRLSGLSRLVRGDRVRRALRRYLGWLLGSTVRSYLDPYIAGEFPVEVENISGACLMLRREAIDQVGLLEESFFMYFEDMDYCLRLRRAGWKLYYLPQGEIVHFVGASSGGRMRNFSVHSYRSLFTMCRRHFPPRTLAFVRLLVLLSSSLRWLWNLIAGSVTSSPACRRNREDLRNVIRLCLE